MVKRALLSLCSFAFNLTSVPILQTVRLPRRRRQRNLRSREDIKKEIKKEIKEAIDKRLRSASSAELNKPVKRLPVWQGNLAMQVRAMEQVEEEDLLHTGDDVENDLPPFEQLTQRKGRK